MTKTILVEPAGKQSQVAPLTPEFTTVQMFPQQQPDHKSVTIWYVFSILATIFCCLPCGVIGLVHSVIARHEGERGHVSTHRYRLHQAKCWTSWAIALGVLGFLVLLAIAGYWYERLG